MTFSGAYLVIVLVSQVNTAEYVSDILFAAVDYSEKHRSRRTRYNRYLWWLLSGAFYQFRIRETLG